MPQAIQRRRGTTADHAAFTGLQGELTVDTTKKTVVVHDGGTAGGTPLATEAALTGYVARTSPTGAARWPAGTTAERPSVGVIPGDSRFNTTLDRAEVYTNAGTWEAMGGGATGAPGNNVFHLNDTVITDNFPIPAGKNAGTFGPVSINTGVTVTVPTGATWSIV